MSLTTTGTITCGPQFITTTGNTYTYSPRVITTTDANSWAWANYREIGVNSWLDWPQSNLPAEFVREQAQQAERNELGNQPLPKIKKIFPRKPLRMIRIQDAQI